MIFIAKIAALISTFVFAYAKSRFSRDAAHNVYYHQIPTLNTVKFLNFWTPENFAVIYLKFKQRGKTLGYFLKKMQMELQTVKTLIRLLL